MELTKRFMDFFVSELKGECKYLVEITEPLSLSVDSCLLSLT